MNRTWRRALALLNVSATSAQAYVALRLSCCVQCHRYLAENRLAME